jgi:hypothetical protein
VVIVAATFLVTDEQGVAVPTDVQGDGILDQPINDTLLRAELACQDGQVHVSV